ncbi:hypothetical protein ARMA_0832 [Ardenticatena maritima]|uniref:Lipoyl-binding domain-containing protein n=1 Tax=Ardenticatena maritima TaxID=872965 RepID=A0A0M8K849_9CHLR|nr:acetyl-CoA carboxylase biotin carboxyl carrier protein subunit [Ardenticatena maritima]GAP62409.1 hypothetical protein ARMA_0832 [Ardenticatena maritima]
MERYYEYNGEIYTVRIESLGETFRITIGDRQYTVEAALVETGRLRAIVEGRHLDIVTARQNRNRYVALDGETYHLRQLASKRKRRVGEQGGGSLEAQMPGQVVSVLVEEGQAVQAGQPLIILEAMKMELRITAPADGIVTKLYCQPGDVVERGQKLVDVSDEA